MQAVAANNLIRSLQLPGPAVTAGRTEEHLAVTGFDPHFSDVLAFLCMVQYFLERRRRKKHQDSSGLFLGAASETEVSISSTAQGFEPCC